MMNDRVTPGIVMPMAEQRGGVERMLVNMLRANREGPDIDYRLAFLEEGPMVEKISDLGYETEVFRAGRLRQINRYIKTVYSLKRWFDSHKIDVVLSWQSKAHLYSGVAALFHGIPATWYVHSLPSGTALERLITLVPADRVFCCGRSAAQHQQQIWPYRETRVVYIAVDLDEFDPSKLPTKEKARQQLDLNPNSTYVGIVARLQRWKGVHIFLEAAERLADQYEDLRFVVVGGEHWGEPNYPDALQSQVKDAGIDDRVLFAGHQSNVPLWMHAMDVLVHASFDEPTGTVIIEGMALEKPVVAAQTTGPMEFVEDNINGMLAPPGDADELANAIQELLSKGNELDDVKKAARETALRYSKERLAQDLANELRMVVSQAD